MPTYALNFYNPAVADQLRTGRKTAPIASAFAVACEECDAPVRGPELFGTSIRRPGR